MNASTIFALCFFGALMTAVYFGIVGVRRWYHRRWIEWFRRHRAFKESNWPQVDQRSAKNKYPQDWR